MNPATWRERICNTKAHISESWALIVIDVSIGAPESGPIVMPMREVERAAERGKVGLTRYMEALAEAAGAGWLAPLEWGPRGELRTALRVPEGC